jgi:hypothetical protein
MRWLFLRDSCHWFSNKNSPWRDVVILTTALLRYHLNPSLRLLDSARDRYGHGLISRDPDSRNLLREKKGSLITALPGCHTVTP